MIETLADDTHTTEDLAIESENQGQVENNRYVLPAKHVWPLTYCFIGGEKDGLRLLGADLISQAEEILNQNSGWKALTWTTDFDHISSSSDPQCRLAFDIVMDRLINYVGSYYVKLEVNVDTLVFAGGIGEKADLLRSRVVEKCRCLGSELAQQKNEGATDMTVQDISSQSARHRTLVCQTYEQVQSYSTTYLGNN